MKWINSWNNTKTTTSEKTTEKLCTAKMMNVILLYLWGWLQIVRYFSYHIYEDKKKTVIHNISYLKRFLTFLLDIYVEDILT